MNVSVMFRWMIASLLLVGVLLTAACERKNEQANGNSSLVMDEKRLETEYRSLLAETGLPLAGQSPAPNQLEQKQYEQVLMVAAGHSSAELFVRLLNARSDVNLMLTVDGKSLLHAATSTLQSANSNLLLERGVDPNVRDSQGRTPLHITVVPAAGVDLTRLLLARGAKVDEKDEQGMTPLMSASPASIKLLVDRGANLASQDTLGNSALHWAVARKNLDLVRALIENSAPLDLQDSAGQTPLHRAVSSSDIQLIQLLLKAGAKVDIPDRTGITAQQLGQKSSYSQVKALLGTP